MELLSGLGALKDFLRRTKRRKGSLHVSIKEANQQSFLSGKVTKDGIKLTETAVELTYHDGKAKNPHVTYIGEHASSSGANRDSAEWSRKSASGWVQGKVTFVPDKRAVKKPKK